MRKKMKELAGFVIIVVLVCILVWAWFAKRARVYNEMTGANVTTSQMFWLEDSIVTDQGKK